MRPAVQSLTACLRLGVHVALELEQGAPVHLALKLDHAVERDPVVVPAPGVEFGMIARAQADVGVAPRQPQQIPDLLLAAVAAAPFALDPVLGDFVAQPVARPAQDPDMVLTQTDFLAQLPVHRLFGRFTVIDATLRELPRVFANPFAPENLVPAVDDDDGDVRAIAVTVEHRFT